MTTTTPAVSIEAEVIGLFFLRHTHTLIHTRQFTLALPIRADCLNCTLITAKSNSILIFDIRNQ